ncbi:mucin-17-like [Triplophysa dalaica]|uniref:mucin-17-like n=1 Tax=Triplophysa dalaica TaxID=1582913 RepID=UPI0024DFFA82|nr:mucin-17-like [Triplophysa dalaica]
MNGMVNYTFQDGDAIQPVSFLNLLRLPIGSTTTVSPLTTSMFPVTSLNQVSGSAVVTTRLVFNSSPVPSKDLVLSAITTLRNSRESQLNETVKVVNFTYEKISETSYALVITFALSNISIPVNPELRNNTFSHVQNIANNALNTLLNEPTSAVLQPKTSDFTSTSDQMNGMVNYTFQDGDAIQPVSFLNLLRLPIGSTTTVSPLTTSMFPVTSLNQVSGSAVVTTRLVFNSSPVPSKDLVLSAITTLRNSRESQLNETVKVVNFTYEKISDTSYALVITFALSNISIPVNPELRNNTFSHVQNIANNALNTLLNEPTSAVLQPKTSDFTSTSDQMNGMVNYTFQDGDAIQPVSFLNLLRLPIGSTTTVSPLTTSMFPVTSLNQVSGSAVVTTRLVFNSSPVPSENLVLSAITTLRNSRESQLNETVKVVNFTYEKISDTSYALVITFALSNISIPVNPELRNNTFSHVQNITNNALNTLLNEPINAVLQPKTSDFTSTSDQINGMVNYTFQDGDAIQPVSFLNLLRLPIGSTTTVSPLTTSMFPVTSLNQVSGSAVVTTRLVFNSSPVPSKDLVLSAITTLRNSRESQLNETVKVVNFTYENISDTSYAVIFTFTLSNISMPKDPESRNDTFNEVQNIVNKALNTLLNEPTNIFQPKFSDLKSTSDQIHGNMDYTFQDADAIRPVSFLNLLQLPIGLTTINTLTASTTLPPIVLGTAIIYIELVFFTLGPAPNENSVLQIANSLLDAKLRTRRDVQTLKDPVSFMNITYKRITENQYTLTFGFEIGNVSMSEKFEFRNDTHEIVQDKINELLSKILNDPKAATFKFPARFEGNSTVIRADVQYVFREGDIGAPSQFLEELLKINGVITTPAPATTFYPTLVNNSTSAAWVVAIIVPCAIAIMLVPCWILLCCMLCGCCARIRRRWHRRQSYNVQYTTRHSLF